MADNDLEFSLGLNNGPFKRAGEDTVKASGEIAGGIAKKFEFKDIGRTLATALGLNLENIAQNIARILTGVSEEQEAALRKAGDISDQITEIYRQIYAARNTLEQNLNTKIHDGNRLQQERDGILAGIAAREKTAQDYLNSGSEAALAYKLAAQQTAKETNRLAEIDLELAKNKQVVEEDTRQKKVKDLAYQQELQGDVTAAYEQDRKINEANQKLADEDFEKRRLQGSEARDALILEAKLIAGTITPAEKYRLDILKLVTKQLQVNADIDEALLVPANQRNQAQRDHLATLFSQNDKLTKQIDLLKGIASAAGGVAQVAAKVDDSFGFALGKLKSFVDEWTGFTTSVTTTGRGNSALSDRELQRKIDETNKDIAARKAGLLGGVGGVGSGGQGPYDPFLGAQQSNLTQAQAELDFRNQVRQAVALFGEDRAFNQFPGLTESRLRDIVGTATDATRQTDIAQKTYDLLKQGIITVNKS